jgi:RNA polymerase-interacting CarD/CdnL/TRCF family regulator
MWVPVDGSPGGLRKLTPKGDLAKYRGLLKSRPTPLATDHRQRQIEVTERLKQGSFQARCEVVRDLTAHSWHKPLTESSAILLRFANEVLYQEWAAAEGLSLLEATHEVEALLLEGKQTYKK